MASSKPHATVIGAGSIGISCAVHLQSEGYDVTVIDRVPPGQGCSFGNAGGVVPCSVLPEFHAGVLTKLPGWLLDPLGPLHIRWRHLPKALPWMLKAARCVKPSVKQRIIEGKAALSLRVLSDYDDIMGKTGTAEMLNRVDGIRLFDSEEQYRAEEGNRNILREYGFDQKRISPGELRELEPDIATDFALGTWYDVWYSLKNPATFVAAMAEAMVRNGGTVLQDDVVSAEHDGTRALKLVLREKGEMAVDRLVIAAGAYSDLLAKQLGTRTMLEAERGYHLTIPDPGVKINRNLTWAARHGAAVPLDVGLRLAGTDEFAGVDAPPNWERANVLWKMFKRVLPNMRPLDDSAQRWMGRRPGTPDSLPVIGPSPNLENVWYAFGHGHLGMTWGPTTGRLIAEMMAGKPSNIDLYRYRIDRF
ncbi:MAG: FAD-binding oxidoreductase [Hyphomicrobiales bacterium]|nr:FAD-binding oxidoreductase [Hyphomicrobiales bacterium]